MVRILLSGNLVKLLNQIKKSDGGLKRPDQEVYDSRTGYYYAIKKLKESGFIECDSKDKKEFKCWVLTKKGKKFLNHINKANELVGGE